MCLIGKRHNFVTFNQGDIMVTRVDFSDFNLLNNPVHKDHVKGQAPLDLPVVMGLVPSDPYDLDLKLQAPKNGLDDIRLTGSNSCTCNSTCEGCRQTDIGCYQTQNCQSTSHRCGHTDSCN